MITALVRLTRALRAMHHEQVYAMECLPRLTPALNPPPGPGSEPAAAIPWPAGTRPRGLGQPQRQRLTVARRRLAGVPGTVAPGGSRIRSGRTPTTC